MPLRSKLIAIVCLILSGAYLAFVIGEGAFDEQPLDRPQPSGQAEDAADAPALVGVPPPRALEAVADPAPVAAPPAVDAQALVPAQAPVPFDPAAFAADPQRYLEQVVPERVFQCADPALDVISLAAVSPLRGEVVLGGSLALAVRTLPAAPVTWCTADGGTFANGRSTMSVRADAAGIASIDYRPSPGTWHLARVLAASPVASGRVGFAISVIRPDLAQERLP